MNILVFAPKVNFDLDGRLETLGRLAKTTVGRGAPQPDCLRRVAYPPAPGMKHRIEIDGLIPSSHV
jgi:hypothetical protein